MKLQKIGMFLATLLLLVGSFFPTGIVSAQASQPPVTAGLCQVKTDMQLQWLYGLYLGGHSRTQNTKFSHIPGGQTPATIRLQGGVGNVDLGKAWPDFVARINGRNQTIINYLTRDDSGWHNSGDPWRVEELVFEGQWLEVIRVSGMRAYIRTFHTDELQPISSSTTDPRIQLFTVVTRQDTLVGSPKGNIYILLMGRPAESLWIGTQYLTCPSRLPKTVTVTAYPALNLRDSPVITGLRTGSVPQGSAIIITGTQTDAQGNVWGFTGQGWVALRYNGQLFTDWQV